MNACSIIIPTYNRLENLKECINSVLRLGLDIYEIVVIDDCSTDGTEEYLNNLKDDKIKIFRNKKNLGPSRSRNIGAKTSKYTWLAFIDDDCIADKNWLKDIKKNFTDKKTAFVIGQTFYIKKNYKGNFPERLVSNINAHWPMSSNIIFDRNIFMKNGGFSQKFYEYRNEDTELAIRLLSRGYTFSRAKNWIVHHQKAVWTAKQLLNTAKNLSVWPILKKQYPKHYLSFRPSNIKAGMIINPEDYLLILLWPILLLRYFFKGGRDLKIFIAKWPILIILRRYFIFKESIKNKVLMV